MIKLETIGMLDSAKINPVLTSNADVKNYDFITVDDILYLICNTIVGDDSYKDNVVIKAGEYLNGYQVDAFVGQKLVVDGKHIAFASGKSIADFEGGEYMTANSDGKLAVVSAKPASGVYFEVTDIGINLTEAAVKVRVCKA